MDVHLYKQKNSKYWWVRYTDNGKLVRKSTKCVKKSEAKDVANLERQKWKRRIGIGVREKITVPIRMLHINFFNLLFSWII